MNEKPISEKRIPLCEKCGQEDCILRKHGNRIYESCSMFVKITKSENEHV